MCLPNTPTPSCDKNSRNPPLPEEGDLQKHSSVGTATCRPLLGIDVYAGGHGNPPLRLRREILLSCRGGWQSARVFSLSLLRRQLPPEGALIIAAPKASLSREVPRRGGGRDCADLSVRYRCPVGADLVSARPAMSLRQTIGGQIAVPTGITKLHILSVGGAVHSDPPLNIVELQLLHGLLRV